MDEKRFQKESGPKGMEVLRITALTGITTHLGKTSTGMTHEGGVEYLGKVARARLEGVEKSVQEFLKVRPNDPSVLKILSDAFIDIDVGPSTAEKLARAWIQYSTSQPRSKS